MIKLILDFYYATLYILLDKTAYQTQTHIVG